MEEKRRKLWSLLALVASGLVLFALAALGASAWATPAQNGDQTIPAAPWKTIEQSLVLPCGCTAFDLEVTVPPASLKWDNVVITDTVDPDLIIYGVETSPPADVVDIDGQTVVISYTTIPPGATVTGKIKVRVKPEVPCGHTCPNCAEVYADNFEAPMPSAPVTLTVGYPVYVPLVMKGYSAP